MRRDIFNLIDSEVHPVVNRIDSDIHHITESCMNYKIQAAVYKCIQDKVWDAFDGGEVHEQFISGVERL